MNNKHGKKTGVPWIRAIELQGGTPRIKGASNCASSAARCHPAVLGARGVPRMPAAAGLVGALVLFMLATPPAEAVLGVGDIVSDPGAYSYFVEQINAANKQIMELRKQVETLGGIKTVMQDVKYSAEGVYGRGVGILDTVQGVADNVGDFGSSIRKSTDFSDFSKGKFNKRASPYREVNVRLDGVFKDPRAKDYDFWKDNPKRENARQQIYKDNLNQAEVTLEEMPKRLERLGKLSDQIEQTKGLKDAADLQNRFLAELLLIQQEALKMLSHIAQALAVTKYEGIQPDVAKEAVDKAGNPVPRRDYFHEHAATMGVVGISDDELKRKLNESWSKGAKNK